MALALTLLGGCAGPGEPPAGPEAGGPARAPLLAPPPARTGALSRAEVLAIAQAAEEPEQAVNRLDASPFSFPLDEAALDWFGRQGVDPEVLDYLRKRSRVDWESLRGDVDPERDPPR